MTVPGTGDARFDAINQLLVEVYGYYRQELRESEIMMWHRKLARYPVETIGAAFDLHLDRSGFCPRFSDILDLVAPRSKALVFEDLVHNVMNVGPYQTPVFEQPETAEIVERLGGWQTVCQEMPGPSEPAAFDSYRKRVDALFEPVSIRHAMQERARLMEDPAAAARPALEMERPHGRPAA